MTLTLRVLGAGTPYPTPGCPCSGYLAGAAGTLVLVDLGHAVWPELLRHTDPGDLDAIWISHLHPDHCVDLFAAYQWAGNTPGAPRLRVYGPAGWAERIGAALPIDNGGEQIRRLFDVREHTEVPEQIGDIELRAVPVKHSVPTCGLRLTYRNQVLAYSGDSGPCDGLSRLATDADIFLCEAGAAVPGQPYHCAPEEAASIGRAARRLILTHLAPGLALDDASSRAGGAVVAHPGLTVKCA
jgi:ribonuclease BN (tRNA processing enzyme)